MHYKAARLVKNVYFYNKMFLKRLRFVHSDYLNLRRSIFLLYGSFSCAAVTEGAPLRKMHGTTILQFKLNVMRVKYDCIPQIMSIVTVCITVIICVCAFSETLSGVYASRSRDS